MFDKSNQENRPFAVEGQLARKPSRFGSFRLVTIKGSFAGVTGGEFCTEASIAAAQNFMDRKAISKPAVKFDVKPAIFSQFWYRF